MKKELISLCLIFALAGFLKSQCVSTCSNYAVSPITFTTFPTGITTPTSGFLPNSDDGITTAVLMGFNFNFYCNTYNQVYICSNGFIQFDYGTPPLFGSPAFAHPTQSFPDAIAPNGMVAFNMIDLDPTVGGSVSYTTIGTSPNQMFIVTYSNVPMFGQSSQLNTGQIVLYETSNIIDIYTGGANGGFSYGTQGIENTLGSIGVTPSGRNNNASWFSGASNSAFRFAPYTPAPPSSITGNTLLCQGDVDSYQASFIIGATSYNWTFPFGWMGTSTLSSITATSGASGNLSVTATYTCGTSLPAVLNVSVTPAPFVSITSITPAIICSGKTVTINTSGAVSYTLNPGGINGTPPFTDVPLTTTQYTLTGTSAFGCVSVNNPMTTITVKDTPVMNINSGSICLGQTFTFTPTGAPQYVITDALFGTASPTLPGQYTYSVIGTGTNGCVSDPAVSSLTVYSLPNVGAAASRTAICVKESVSISATGANTYLWSNSSVSPTIIVSPVTNTFYVVTGTDVNGCKNTSTVNMTVKPCTGLDELENANFVKLYPNPNDGVFEIKLDNFDDKTFLEIYNALGQLVTREVILSEITQISLKDHPNGLYHVKIRNTSTEQVVKVIKQ